MLKSLRKIQSQSEHESVWQLNAMTMESWVDRWSMFADILVLHPREQPGRNFVRDYVSGSIAGSRMMMGCQLVHHARRHVENTGGTIMVQRVHDGFTAMEFSGSTFVHRPGYIAIVDLQNEYRASHHGTVSEQILIPRARLGVSDLHPMAPLLISEESPVGQVLAQEVDRFFADHATRQSFDSGELERVIRNLFHEDLYPASDREEWWRGRKKLVRKYIETHLEDPNLGPLQICHLFNMSRATLYRMFEADGGVRRFIQDRRLFSAIWDLATGGIRRGRLSRVAEKWGFSSDANFNRAAKAAFGMPPGAFFRDRWQIQSLRGEGHQASFAIFDWIRAHRSLKHSDNSLSSRLFAL